VLSSAIGSIDTNSVWLIWALITFHDLKITFVRIYGYFIKTFASECFNLEHQYKFKIALYGHLRRKPTAKLHFQEFCDIFEKYLLPSASTVRGL